MDPAGLPVLAKRAGYSDDGPRRQAFRGPRSPFLDSAELLNDQQEVDTGNPHEPNGHVWRDRHHLAIQAVQELLQLALVPRHPDVESMDFVGHGLLSSAS